MRTKQFLIYFPYSRNKLINIIKRTNQLHIHILFKKESEKMVNSAGSTIAALNAVTDKISKP